MGTTDPPMAHPRWRLLAASFALALMALLATDALAAACPFCVDERGPTMVDDYLHLYQRLTGQDVGMHLTDAPQERLAQTPEPIQLKRPLRPGARCDACHAYQPKVQRSRDGLLTICRQCARGVDLATSDAGEAIAALVSRAPAGERRALTRRLLARQTMHEARRERRSHFVDKR